MESPVHQLLADYVLDILGALTPEREEILGSMDLPKVFAVEAVGWREALKKALHLSDTLPIAVLELWLKTRERAGYEPGIYAAEFVAAYLKDGSRVDVWEAGGVEAARRLIASTPEGARLLAK